MIKKMAAVFLMAAAFALPAKAAMKIDTVLTENENGRIVSMIMAAQPSDGEGEAPQDDEAMQAMMNANLLIQKKFPMAQYLIAMNRAQGSEVGVHQTLRLYDDGKSASIAVLWQGKQADGTSGSTVQTLVLDLETGEEIVFDDLFSDPQAAAKALETIVSDSIVHGLSDYMEYADLLPLPLDSFSYDEHGLTIYYPQERYLYFSGRSGAVHFAWHEIDHLIAEEGPVYTISRPAAGDAQGIAEQLTTGCLPGALNFGVGDRLGDALDAHTLLCDPDYTRESLVYQFEDEMLRGFALEIPKYAETAEEETPISAVRSSRAALPGLVTGETTRMQAETLLGEPEQIRAYDADTAKDMMIAAGESLLYSMGGHVLQLHFNDAGVLDTIILRNAMPETLY